MTARAVRVEFVCPYISEHFLGSVGRQVVASAGTPLVGAESVFPGPQGGLEDVRHTNGRKLRGRCEKCARKPNRTAAPEIKWENVQRLLDAAEATDDGVLRVPMRF